MYNFSGPLGTIVAGAVGGLSLWTVIYPFDLVKSRTQVQTTATKNFVLVMIDIIKAEGNFAFHFGINIIICGMRYYQNIDQQVFHQLWVEFLF